MSLELFTRHLSRLTVASLVLPGCLNAVEVKLAWDPNTEKDLAGYKLHYGPISGTYAHVVDVGNVTTYMIKGLDPDTVYFFAATAYDTQGNESGFSKEVEHRTPPALKPPAPATDGQIHYIKIPPLTSENPNLVFLPGGSFLLIFLDEAAGN